MSKRLLLTVSLFLGFAAFAGAQPAPTRETGTRDVSVDPIRCWWRTSAGAVRIGERRFEIKSHGTHVGSICWDCVQVDGNALIQLMQHLISTDAFNCDSGWSELYQAWEDRTFDINHLQVLVSDGEESQS